MDVACIPHQLQAFPNLNLGRDTITQPNDKVLTQARPRPIHEREQVLMPLNFSGLGSTPF